MCQVARQIPHLEVIAFPWFVWVTDTIHMARRSIRVQRGPLHGVDGFGTFDMRPLSLLHELN